MAQPQMTSLVVDFATFSACLCHVTRFVYCVKGRPLLIGQICLVVNVGEFHYWCCVINLAFH